MRETFWTLLHDSAHWEFEIFLLLLEEGALALLAWFALGLRKHWSHHIARDIQDGIVVSKPELGGICADCQGVFEPIGDGLVEDRILRCNGCGAFR